MKFKKGKKEGKKPKPKAEVPFGVEYKSYINLKILSISSIIVFVSIFLATIWFAYSYIYKTIDTTDAALILQRDPGTRPINFKLYQETKVNLEKKFTTTSMITKNPFNQEVIEEKD